MAGDGKLTEIVEELHDKTDARDKVELGSLVDALDARGYGPALAILPLAGITPIAGVPGVPTLLALILGVIALRLLLGYDHLWLPEMLRRRRLDAARVRKSVDWLKPLSRRLDRGLNARLEALAGPTARRVACVVILALLACVPPLEMLPLAAAGPMLVVAVFGLGLLYRDGLLMLAGFVGAALVAGGAAWAAFGPGG